MVPLAKLAMDGAGRDVLERFQVHVPDLVKCIPAREHGPCCPAGHASEARQSFDPESRPGVCPRAQSLSPPTPVVASQPCKSDQLRTRVSPPHLYKHPVAHCCLLVLRFASLPIHSKIEHCSTRTQQRQLCPIDYSFLPLNPHLHSAPLLSHLPHYTYSFVAQPQALEQCVRLITVPREYRHRSGHFVDSLLLLHLVTYPSFHPKPGPLSPSWRTTRQATCQAAPSPRLHQAPQGASSTWPSTVPSNPKPRPRRQAPVLPRTRQRIPSRWQHVGPPALRMVTARSLYLSPTNPTMASSPAARSGKPACPVSRPRRRSRAALWSPRRGRTGSGRLRLSTPTQNPLWHMQTSEYVLSLPSW